MQPILVMVVGIYLAVGFVVLFRQLRQRSGQIDLNDARLAADPWAWIVVAALWPLFFRVQRPPNGNQSDRDM